MKRIMLSIFMLALMAGGSWAATLTVPSGTYPTIQDAVNAAIDNDVIIVSPGTYPETITFDSAFNVNNLTIEGSNTVDATFVTGGINFQNSTDFTGLSLQNLYLTGGSPAVGRIVNMGNQGAVTDLIMDKCVIDGENFAGRASFYGANMGGSITITNCEIKNVAHWAVMDLDGSGGTGLPTTNIIFSYNNIHDCAGTVAIRGDDADRTGQVDVFNNTFTDISGSAWAGIEINKAHVINVNNNTFTNVVAGVPGLYMYSLGTMDVHDNAFANCGAGIALPCVVNEPAPLGGIYNNSFIGTAGDLINTVFNTTAFTTDVNAEGNYWGTADVAVIASKMVGQVDYSPWLALPLGSIPMTIGTNDFVQDAVNLANAGDTVIVAAGSYAGTVSLNKTITLLGANAGVHPAVGTHSSELVGVRGAETILTNNFPAIVPSADDCTVDGFKFTGSGGRIIDTYADANGFHLTNCIFDDGAVATTQGVIQFGGGSHVDMTIDFNLFQDQGDHTIYTGGGPFDRMNISWNRFNVLGESLFWAASALVDGVIQGNELDGTIGGVPGTGYCTFNAGQLGNVQIKDNWCHDLAYTPFQVGIIGGSITNNVIEQIYPYPGNYGYCFQLWGGLWGTAVSDNVAVEDNIFRFNDIPGATLPIHGFDITTPDAGGGAGVDGATIVFRNNQFLDGGIVSGSLALRHRGDSTKPVDAVGNDWGSASGPYHATRNPGGTGAPVGDYVTFTPWNGRTVSLIADLGIDPSGRTLVTDGYGYWEGTPAVGLDNDYAPGFDPGALQANVTAGDPEDYTKYGFIPTAIFGRDVYVGELYNITYFTQKGTDHVVEAGDWFVQMYTNGTANGWYGDRINAEPYFSEDRTEIPGEWTQWVTGAGQNNRLQFFDSNLSLGSYSDGFLQDMANDPAYADQSIMLFGLCTGRPWAVGFDGKVDGLTVELNSGEKVTFNFITGNASVTATPSTSGPLMCEGEEQTLTFSLTTDQYTPDVFGFSAVVRATGEVHWNAPVIATPAPFGTSTQFQTFDYGDSSYLISGTTVGDPSMTQPIRGAGTTDLFSVTYTTFSEGTANITFDSLVLRDPNNVPIPVVGTGATIVVDCTAPAAVTGITAAPGHNKVNVDWAHPGTATARYLVYRGLWHNGTVNTSAYPEYDDVAIATPTTRPATPTAANTDPEWVLADTVTVGTTALTDLGTVAGAGTFDAAGANRGVYYYEVFAVDAAGNVSPPASANDRATNYWLGDIAGVIPSPIPDGLVNSSDINQLATAFGMTATSSTNVLDVGPTDDWSRVGIPTTDSAIGFEDLMIFSMNFGVVSAAKVNAPANTPVNLAWVTYDDGSQALRLVTGSSLKGLRVQAGVPVGSVEAGQLLDDQSELTFLKNVGTNLDVSVAVMGINQAFEGNGDLLIVRSGSGIKVADLHITARGADNSTLKFSMDEASGTLTPRVFALNANYPNPFNPMTKISFSLPEAQDVKLAVYSIDGRKVATLINETRGPGLHEVVWTGRDDQGQTVSSGMYFYRLDAGPYSQVRKMTLMK